MSKTLGKVGNLSAQNALRQLVGVSAGLLANRGTPLSAKSLEPLIKAILEVGDTVSARFSEELTNRLIARIGATMNDQAVTKLADQIAEIVAEKFADKVVQKLAKQSMVTRLQ
jgi:hypothetical protein